MEVERHHRRIDIQPWAIDLVSPIAIITALSTFMTAIINTFICHSNIFSVTTAITIRVTAIAVIFMIPIVLMITIAVFLVFVLFLLSLV